VSRCNGKYISVTTETYDLKELCRLAQVTPRTVHFYIQQGVLPPAGSRGPGVRYTQGHLARLRLVKCLQREHLPLAEIRQRLVAMTDEEVVLALADSGPRPGEAAGSALEYVRQVLASREGPPSAVPQPDFSSWAPAPAELQLPLDAALERPRRRPRWSQDAASVDGDGLRAFSPPAPVTSAPAVRPAVPDRSQWERYVLTPDVELHLRRPLTREMNRRVERLLAAARDILQEA
jgi:DNA-binding transcriptional MerR regulator